MSDIAESVSLWQDAEERTSRIISDISDHEKSLEMLKMLASASTTQADALAAAAQAARNAAIQYTIGINRVRKEARKLSYGDKEVSLERDAFIEAMAKRFEARGSTPIDAAIELARETLDAMPENVGIHFGEGGYGWTEADAQEMADEEMMHWEPA